MTIGTHSYAQPILVAFEGDEGNVTIGKFCSIAPDVKVFVGGNHRVDWISMYPFRLKFGLAGALRDGHPASKGDVVIGNDVWIGAGATIMSGVQIGDGAVVGAASVVARDVADYAIVVGNPAREIRRRFEAAQVAALKRIRWWEWSLDQILAAVPLLNGGEISTFVDRYDPGEDADAQPSEMSAFHR